MSLHDEIYSILMNNAKMDEPGLSTITNNGGSLDIPWGGAQQSLLKMRKKSKGGGCCCCNCPMNREFSNNGVQHENNEEEMSSSRYEKKGGNFNYDNNLEGPHYSLGYGVKNTPLIASGMTGGLKKKKTVPKKKINEELKAYNKHLKSLTGRGIPPLQARQLMQMAKEDYLGKGGSLVGGGFFQTLGDIFKTVMPFASLIL